jgi:hypothetical protein
VASVAFPKKKIARREFQPTGFLTKKIRRIHECSLVGGSTL